MKWLIEGKGGCWSHPTVTSGQLTYSDSAMGDGSKVVFSCNSSLYVSGPKEKKCRASSWTPDESVTCRNISWSNRYIIILHHYISLKTTSYNVTNMLINVVKAKLSWTVFFLGEDFQIYFQDLWPPGKLPHLKPKPTKHFILFIATVDFKMTQISLVSEWTLQILLIFLWGRYTSWRLCSDPGKHKYCQYSGSKCNINIFQSFEMWP